MVKPLLAAEALDSHGQMGWLGSNLSPKLSSYCDPLGGKHWVHMSPMVSPLQVKCQSSLSLELMPKPPEVAPNAFMFAAKHTHVLYMAHEPVAWNLHAWHADSFEANALSSSFAGSSTLGSGGSPNLPAWVGKAWTFWSSCFWTSANVTSVFMLRNSARVGPRASAVATRVATTSARNAMAAGMRPGRNLASLAAL